MTKAGRRTFSHPQEMGFHFLRKATENYISSRILYLHHQIFDAGVLAHEALEKVMKAKLYLHNPDSQLGKIHELNKLRVFVEEEFGLNLTSHEPILMYYQDCYNHRYPDNPSKSFNTSSYHYQNIDAAFKFYHDLCLESFKEETVKYRSGIYEHCLFYFQFNRVQTIQTLIEKNHAFTKASLDTIKKWWVDRGYFTFNENRVMLLPGGSSFQVETIQ
jgi:HEPN domain-containing protein